MHLFMDDEAQVVRKFIAPSNPTLANCILTHSSCTIVDPIRPTYVDQDYDDDVTVLRIFVMFKYHEYLIPDHYHDSKVLCGERSFAINDILRNLYDEAKP